MSGTDLQESLDSPTGLWLDNDMTTATATKTRTAQLAEARSNVEAARHAWENATTKKAAAEADDELQFWISKATMLALMVKEGV